MAGRGQIPNPALRRYDALAAAPAVYVIEAGPFVKVGRARSARARLCELHTSLKRRGMQPGRFQIFYTSHPERLELKCIHALQGTAGAAVSGREYFALGFDRALDLLTPMFSPFPAPTLHLSPPPGAVSRPPA